MLPIDQQHGDEESDPAVLSNLGVALRNNGAFREAAGRLRQALVIYHKFRDIHGEAIVQNELGNTLSATGSHELSLVTLKRSLHIFGKVGDQSGSQGQGVVSAYLAERWLWLGDFRRARAFADRAWKLAGVPRLEQDFIRAALLQGRAALGLGDLEVADERLHHVLIRARTVNLVEMELPALIAIAEFARAQSDLVGAKARLEEVWDAAERGPYPRHQADAYNLLADIAWAQGQKKWAIEAATKAYRAAWCDGPPWAYHWGLEKAKAHLQAFGAPEPEMPLFDESRFEPMPEAEINPRDDYWVDPDALD